MEGGKENAQPGSESGLARMFREGNKAIGTHKTSDLFKQLESRSLTEHEETIIQQRLDLQRKMLLAYERQEKARKIQDLQQVCPDLSTEEAERALELCNGREDVAAGQIVSDPAFRRRLRPTAVGNAPAVTATRSGTGSRKASAWNARPSTRRPKQVDPASLGDSVFVGSFRGGKRGGSRTAHLKAPAGDDAAAVSRQNPTPSAWRSARSRQPASRQAAVSRQKDSHSHSLAAPTLTLDEAEPIEIEDEDEQGQQQQNEEDGVNAEEEDEEISDVEDEEEAGRTGLLTDSRADAIHVEDSGELVFEVDVVDALASMPGSQPESADPSGSEPQQAMATGVQAPAKDRSNPSESGRANSVSPSRGARQSRRLAALTEAGSPPQPEDHSTTIADSGQQSASVWQHKKHQAPATEAAAEAAAGMTDSSRQEGGNQASQLPSPSLLQASTLEASANVLKGLTLATGLKFLKKMQPDAMQGTLEALQMLDPEKAELLRAKLPDSTSGQSNDSKGSLADVVVAADAPGITAEGPQPQNDSSGAVPTKSDPPVQAIIHAAGLKPDSQTASASDPIVMTHGKKRKADKPCTNTAADTDPDAFLDDQEQDIGGHDASVSHAQDESTQPKQARARVGCSKRPRPGTLQAAFAKAKEPAQQQHVGDCGGWQRKKRSGRSSAVPDQAASSLPDQDMQPAPSDSSKPVQTSTASAEDNSRKKNTAADNIKRKSNVAVEGGDVTDDAETKKKRSSRVRVQSDVAMLDAVISDTEQEEEEEGTDAEFVARTKGSKKRGRAARNSPAKKQKGRKLSQPTSPAHPSSPSSGAVKRNKTATSESPPESSSPSDAAKQRRSRRPSAIARLAEEQAEAAAAEAVADAAADTSPAKPARASSESRKGKSAAKPQGHSAIARSGHTNRGRVKQKSHKAAHILEVGSVRAEKGWYNSGYIFPEGFKSQLPFRSSVELDQLCLHECTIIGKGGAHWPQPTYKVIAMDRADEPLLAKSCTGCWTQVLKRINSEIEARRKAGENLPPPPKTAIAGPEYFGLNQPELTEAIEALDPEHKCSEYWHGKADREAAAAGLPPVERGPRPPRPSAGTAPRPKRSKKTREGSDEEAEAGREEEEDDESGCMTNRWSAVSRTERYRKRCGDEGNPSVDATNPLPKLIDPITLEPVVTPAISPFGHVMGLATWKAVLAEQGKCPFTKNDLSWEQCTTLTHGNIDRYRDRIKSL